MECRGEPLQVHPDFLEGLKAVNLVSSLQLKTTK